MQKDEVDRYRLVSNQQWCLVGFNVDVIMLATTLILTSGAKYTQKR